MGDLATELAALAPTVDQVAARASFDRHRRQRHRRRTIAVRSLLAVTIVVVITAASVIWVNASRGGPTIVRVTSPRPSLPSLPTLPPLLDSRPRVIAHGRTSDYPWELDAWYGTFRVPGQAPVRSMCSTLRRLDPGATGSPLGSFAPLAVLSDFNCGDGATGPLPPIVGGYGLEPVSGGTPYSPPPGEPRHHFSLGLVSADARLVVGTVNGKEVSRTRPQPVDGLQLQFWVLEVPAATYYNNVDYHALDGAGHEIGLLTSNTSPHPANGYPTFQLSSPDSGASTRLGRPSDLAGARYTVHNTRGVLFQAGRLNVHGEALVAEPIGVWTITVVSPPGSPTRCAFTTTTHATMVGPNTTAGNRPSTKPPLAVPIRIRCP